MKRLYSSVLLILSGLFIGLATAAQAAEPQAFLPESVFDFGTAVEGSRFIHDFRLQNKGNAQLEILELVSICGCTGASGTKQILPGQEGIIQVKVNTDGYGGFGFREKVSIKTNDPHRPLLEIVIKGKVETFADIRPQRVRLAGKRGKPLMVEVDIIPKQGYPFAIKGIKVDEGKFIRYELEPKDLNGNKHWVLRIENTQNKKGRYLDVLYIQTDSELKPVIPIPITGLIE